MDKILVLSTDPSLRYKYTKELVKNGFRVADASDFLDGMFTASKTKFDVIIIDEDVYGSGESMVFSKVRKYSDAHIILVGKRPVGELRTAGDGFDAYFQRSASPQELVTYIKGVILPPENEEEKVSPQKDAIAPMQSQTESIFNVVTDLEHQVARIRSVMAGLNHMYVQISDAEDIIRQQQQAFDKILKKLSEINRYLESIAGK